MARTLIITADDFGIGFDTSRGIVDAHLAGGVDATSVMTATGDHLERSLPLLVSAQDLKLGLHLTLTSKTSRPLVATTASGLVARDGFFHTLPSLAWRCAVRKVEEEALEEEITAQAERFREVFGRRAEHVDGHHHAQQLPLVSRIVAELAAAGVLPKRIRNTVEPPGIRGMWLAGGVGGARPRRLAIEALGRRSNLEFASVRGIMTDGFFSVLSPDMLGLDNPWAPYLAALPDDGTFEMGVHPGHPDPTLAGRDSYRLQRQIELEALLRFGRARRGPAR